MTTTTTQNPPSRTHTRDLIQPAAKPILFSGPMVRGILAADKTQTRRVVARSNSLVNGRAPFMSNDPDIIGAWDWLNFNDAFVDRGPSPAGNAGPYLQVAGGDQSRHRVYPRVQPGDALWVRESIAYDGLRQQFVYAADRARCGPLAHLRLKKRGCPSIHMPRWASRIQLEVTAVRPERLQDISEQDARAEGCTGHDPEPAAEGGTIYYWQGRSTAPSARAHFVALWDNINGKRAGCSWADNPWVWVISFRRVQP